MANATDTKNKNKPRSLAIDSEFRKIGPDEAAKLLEGNTVNRRLRKRLVEAYSRDMEEGLWRQTGEAIKISRTGQLLDGQHRLEAVRESGATVEFLVITGLADDDQKLMDQGAARTANDAVKLSGVTNSAWAASVARWVYLAPEPGAMMDTDLKAKASTAQILKTLEEHPEIETSAAFYSQMRYHLPGSPTAIGYTHYILSKTDPVDAKLFFDSFVDLTFKGLNDPRKAALRRLQIMERELGSSASKDKALATVSVLTRAWNAWRAGEELQSITVRNNKGRIIAPVKPE